ncbi:MAG TPA: RNA 2',3'-cyclic phosphodiesterase [Solirubrobacterales bacterium]|nr:RNA 2',3'-cyclic phosphodiesterase [Solirubrobacterales bacterium]HMX71112.1 RNA 2',3'-cyclic phosphodiesterase [Solirubrobacterales bacterium]HNA44340.1 RNA 2',3'-cyclic phosphodiesterase [Solirubrobacterales bacterium]HNH85839.1 RNA 2',3'-cyclic phosphodiesterase [Solirubrobacterales bacterium]HNL63001.1 RNA 2',3'-cyclic phosphodiesterase [Solirubrobacterales bacterium]
MSGSSRQNRKRRVFVALDPPVELRSEAEAWARHIARSAKGLRVVPARNSHITLAFLGERDEFEIEEVAGALLETAVPATGLALGAPAWLPKRRPRSLVLDIHDDRGELKELQAGMAGALKSALGWKEDRPYRPHLTCARTGRGFDPSHLRVPVSPSIAFSGQSVTLYASHLGPEGAEYEVIERVDQ